MWTLFYIKNLHKFKVFLWFEHLCATSSWDAHLRTQFTVRELWTKPIKKLTVICLLLIYQSTCVSFIRKICFWHTFQSISSDQKFLTIDPAPQVVSKCHQSLTSSFRWAIVWNMLLSVTPFETPVPFCNPGHNCCATNQVGPIMSQVGPCHRR